jgi:hypothetical protein
MMTALRLARDVERLQAERSGFAEQADSAPLQPAADENVTPLPTARVAKKD